MQPLQATEVLNVLEKLESVINRAYARKDISEDNKVTLKKIQLDHKLATELVRELESFTTSDAVTVKLIVKHAHTLEMNLEELEKLQEEIEKATLTNRVRRAKQVLDRYAADVNEFFEFLKTMVSPKLTETSGAEQDTFICDNNVPPNPPRLTLDYNSKSTVEGKLKAAVLESPNGVVGVIASGAGGVGKSCALRGLATDPQINDRFPGGTLYIQLGNDSKLSDLIKGIATIVQRTGGSSLEKELRTFKILQHASDKASIWFRSRTCLFLIDDIWWINGIDSSTLRMLCTMLNDSSRLVYTTRDQRFLNECDEVIEFSAKDPHCYLARQMLITHAGFKSTHKLKKVNEDAVQGILELCKGLPLAFGIAGATVRSYCRRRVDDLENGWNQYYRLLISNSKTIVDGEQAGYGPMRLVVENSLDVLDSHDKDGSFHERFRALCVLQKQKMVPINMLRSLWSVQTLKDTEDIVDKLNEVSVIRKLYKGSVIFIQPHDIIIDIALYEARARGEMRSFFRKLVSNYISRDQERKDTGRVSMNKKVRESKVGFKEAILQIFRRQKKNEMDEETQSIIETKQVSIDWWNMEDDGYIHDNICRILRSAAYDEQLLWLLSKPQWIVKRVQNGGIYQVDQDLEHGKQVVSEAFHNHQNLFKHLEMVGMSVRMGYGYVNENKREAWFQIHGRLLSYATECERTQKFIQDIEKCAPRLWAKASLGLLHQAGGAASEVLSSPGSVFSVVQNEEKVCFLWGTHPSPTDEWGFNRKWDSSDECTIIGLNEYKFASGTLIKGASKRIGSQGRLKSRYSPFAPENIISMGSHHYLMYSGYDGTRRVQRISSKIGALSVRLLGLLSGGQTEFSADGKRAVCVRGNRWSSGSRRSQWVYAFDVERDRVMRKLMVHNADVTRVAISLDGRLVVACFDDGAVLLWDLENEEATAQTRLGTSRARVNCVAIGCHRRLVVAGFRDGSMLFWCLDDEKANMQERLDRDVMKCIAIGSDGRLVACGFESGTIRVWDFHSKRTVVQLAGHTSRVLSVSISEDGQRVVSGSDDRTVRVWRLDRHLVRREEKRLPVFDDRLDSWVAISRDGRRVVSFQGNLVLVWDASSGKSIASIDHGEEVFDVAVSDDGSVIVSESKRSNHGSRRRNKRYWRLTDGVYHETSRGDCQVPLWMSLSVFSSKCELKKQVKHECADNSQMVLATCEAPVIQFGNMWLASPQTFCTVVADLDTSCKWQVPNLSPWCSDRDSSSETTEDSDADMVSGRYQSSATAEDSDRDMGSDTYQGSDTAENSNTDMGSDTYKDSDTAKSYDTDESSDTYRSWVGWGTDSDRSCRTKKRRKPRRSFSWLSTTSFKSSGTQSE